MRITRLKLTNWRQHHNLDIKFSGNTVGILGPNGCGKSNIVEAIRYALTGDTSRTKARNISWGEDSGSVLLEFISSSGIQCIINRDVVKSSCSIKIGDNPVVRKGVDVNLMMEEVRGVSVPIFNSHVIIQQGKLDSIIKAKPAERAKEFSTLCGLDRCESIHTALGNKIQSYPQIQFDTTPEELELKRRKSVLVESLKVTETLVRASSKQTLDKFEKRILSLTEDLKKEF
jgi:DNA repair exonuclease SbcCD ATPase subunit